MQLRLPPIWRVCEAILLDRLASLRRSSRRQHYYPPYPHPHSCSRMDGGGGTGDCRPPKVHINKRTVHTNEGPEKFPHQTCFNHTHSADSDELVGS